VHYLSAMAAPPPITVLDAPVTKSRDDRRRAALVVLGYVAALASYVAISFLTKRLLTWTNGPLYFLFTLELLPRGVRRLVAVMRP